MNVTPTTDALLLVDGKQAFPEILRRIRSARRSILINMFIWRDDEIGNRIAAALLSAADRGVRITIVKDRYGIVCELCEEGRRSFFHPRPTAAERLSIASLVLLYNPDLAGRLPRGSVNPLARRLRAHPNVTLLDGENRYDHSKYYVFDDETLIFGGVNIEDKENGQDRQGRRYRDYMIEVNGREAVAQFLTKRADPKADGGVFAVNRKAPQRVFEIESRFLSLIDSAERELTILMAYFSPRREFLEAIARACARGVRVRVVVPRLANFTDDTNKRTLTALSHIRKNPPALYLSDRMLHAKLLMSEREITLGSCNITKKAFRQLDELNGFFPNDDSALAAAVRQSVGETIREAHRVRRRGELRHRRLFAMAEGILM